MSLDYGFDLFLSGLPPAANAPGRFFFDTDRVDKPGVIALFRCEHTVAALRRAERPLQQMMRHAGFGLRRSPRVGALEWDEESEALRAAVFVRLEHLQQADPQNIAGDPDGFFLPDLKAAVPGLLQPTPSLVLPPPPTPTPTPPPEASRALARPRAKPHYQPTRDWDRPEARPYGVSARTLRITTALAILSIGLSLWFWAFSEHSYAKGSVAAEQSADLAARFLFQPILDLFLD